MTAAAFTSGQGLIPRVITGAQGGYVIENLSRTTPADSAFTDALPELRQRLVQEKQNRLIREWMQNLRDEAVIEDFRIAISSM